MTLIKMKPKKCKVCSEMFTPFSSLNMVCSKKCEIDYRTALAMKNLKKIKADEKKAWNKKKKDFQQSDKTFWEKLCKTTCHTYIRLRDKDKGCISCGKPLKNGNTDAGHLWSSGGHANLRYHEFNINAQCSRPCNKDLAGDINNYRINFVKRYSKELLEELDKNCKKERKYSITDYQEIIDYYKQKIAEIKKNN